MNWTLILIVGAVCTGLFLLKRMSFVDAETARQHLQGGALVIDVRSRGEFRYGHLPIAINIPLDEIENGLPQQLADKKQALLVHCLSGTRSGLAKRKLKNQGYVNVFNLGSFSRAKQLVNSKR